MKGSRVPNEIRVEIREKFHNGTSISNLVEEYELHRATVHWIIAERYRRGRSRGRPKIVMQREQQRILAYMRSHPLACSPEVVCALDLNISVRTVQRVLSENNFRHNRVMKVKVLTESAREKRLEFARSHVYWSQQTWDLVIFTDEKKFLLVGNDLHLCAWTEGGRRHTVEVPNYSKKGLMVWRN